MNEYLVPANTKKSALILGLFKLIDLIILGIGLVVTIAMLFAFKNPSLVELIIAIAPVCLAVLLVFPVPNYHNVRQLITNIFTYVMGQKNYKWKGWCVEDGKGNK